MNVKRRRGGLLRPYGRLSMILQLLGAGMLAARIVRGRRHAARIKQARKRFAHYADLELEREQQSRRIDREFDPWSPRPPGR